MNWYFRVYLHILLNKISRYTYLIFRLTRSVSSVQFTLTRPGHGCSAPSTSAGLLLGAEAVHSMANLHS